MHSIYFKAALLLHYLAFANGEIKLFQSTLAASSGSVHYSTGYLVDPGSLDLSYVTFTASQDSEFSNTDDGRYDIVDDDNDGTVDEDDYYNNDDDEMAETETSVTSSPTFMVTEKTTEKVTTIANDKNNNTATTDTPEGEQTDDNKNSEEGSDINNEEEIIDDNDGATEEGLDHDNGNRTRHLASQEFTIDVLFFHEPSDCAKTKEGCDWTKLGVGNSDNEGNLRWCCAEDSIALGMCEPSQMGRVIINKNYYKGEHRFLNVPTKGAYTGNLTYPFFTTNAGSGQYTLLLANCNDYGRDIQLDGRSIWQSKGGYLPGDRFEEWHFYIVMMLCYAILFAWYGLSMKKHKESRIGIQSWILGTISLCLLHTFLRTADFVAWNKEGFRSDAILYTSVTAGVIKGAISRSLLIMVSLGWGVIRDTLGDQMKKIILLGGLYLLTAFCRDISERVFVEEVHILSVDEEAAIYDFFTLFTLVTAAIDVVCYMWILDALNGTMQYLENMNQTMKLRQYLRLRLILLLSIIFALFWTVLGVVNTTMDTAILAENQSWVIPAAWSVNYFGILFSIALLWRPNPRAKEFAYVMELPSIGDDLDFESNIGTVEMDDDDDEAAIHQSYSGGVQDGENRMKVQNGVST